MRALPADDWRPAVSALPLTPGRPVSTNEASGPLAAGEVVSITAPAAGDELLIAVVLDATDFEQFTAAPISTEVENATAWDLIVQEDESPLGYPLIVEDWNHSPFQSATVHERFGSLEPAAQDALAELYAADLEGGEPPEGLPVGPPVVSAADPRLDFQRDEEERVTPFLNTQPADVLTLEDLAAEWYARCGADLEEVANEVHWTATALRAFLCGELTPAQVEPEPIGRLTVVMGLDVAEGAPAAALELSALRWTDENTAYLSRAARSHNSFHSTRRSLLARTPLGRKRRQIELHDAAAELVTRIREAARTAALSAER